MRMIRWYRILINYLNQKWVKNDECMISVSDEGFLSGTSVYESLRTYSGNIFHFSDHYKRLRHSADAFMIETPFNESELLELIIEGIKMNSIEEAYIRIQLSLSGTVFLSFSNMPEIDKNIYKDGIKIGISDIRRNPVIYLGKVVKTTASSDVFMARCRFSKKDFYEKIMLNSQGFLAEGTFSNIFIIKNGEIITPSLDTGILDGITRRTVIKHAEAVKEFKVHERKMEVYELFESDEVFLTHTSAGIVPVREICSVKKNNHELIYKLKENFI